ncbi:methyltransferase domain-containing protein [Xylariales sp. AK1849]|nr:methyltransferase domain-containing protein [Xylariales sp. AK1849]
MLIGSQVDTDDDDADSALGSAMPNSSMSATTSIYNFVEEFGRTFHKYKEGKYFLPNDEVGSTRGVCMTVLDWKLYLAPIDSPNRVLDIGTGTGIWAIEFADQHPECDILGTDLSPIQPEYVPANCRFEIDDAEDEWVFTHKFDYIHGRYLCAFLSDCPKLFTSIYDNLNPGGWVEFMETLIYFQSQDGTLEGTALQRWNRLLLEGIRNMGRNAQSCMKYKKWMEEAGFQNVEERKFIVPTFPWAKGRKNKELGALQMANNLNGVYGLTITVFTKGLGWQKEEVEVFLAGVRSDMQDKNIHAYITLMCIYGQKPS